MKGRKVVSFISAPGGVGKTTVALCLGWFLKERNKTNLLIDLDPSLGLTLRLKDIREYKLNIEDDRRTTADLLKATQKGKLHEKSYRDFVTRVRFKNVRLNLMASSMRLEDVMGEIWHSSSLGRSKKLKEALEIIPKEKYTFLLIDVIPCYELKYALLTLISSDICVVPLRLTINDLGRTIQMMKKLEDEASSELSSAVFEDQLYFVFNKVHHYEEDKVGKYKKELLDAFPDAHVFDTFVEKHVHFNRIKTKEEKRGDARKVKEYFKDFYEEFEEKFGNL